MNKKFERPNSNQSVFEMAILVVFFCLAAVISYYHIEKSISLEKYLFEYSIRYLSVNYDLYHHSLKDFLYQTSAFHNGNTEAGWRTAFYLFPLFLFCDFFGGLSLKMVCLFTVTTSLISLACFYWWNRQAWGRQAAFWGAFFLGFSVMFQEIARSGIYDAYSISLAMVWLLLCFRFPENEKHSYFLSLGIFTGLLWYGYCPLRSLTVVAAVRTLYSPSIPKLRAMMLLLEGMLLALLPGILILFKHLHGHNFLVHNIIDRENIIDMSRGSVQHFARIIAINLRTFMFRMLGHDQAMEGFPRNLFHAHFWHPLLVLPLFAGIGHAAMQRRQPKYQLLLVLALTTYLIPLMSSAFGYVQARRSLQYIIPSYCFIGLGMAEIYNRINGIGHLLRRLMKIFLIMIIYLLLLSEMDVFQKHILTSRGDAGLLKFSEGLKGTQKHGVIYYLEDPHQGIDRTYFWARESDILRVALMDHGQSNFSVQSVNPRNLLAKTPEAFYVAQSPLVTPKEFEQWYIQNKLKISFILRSPFNNVQRIKKPKEPFKFYAARTINQ